MLLLAAGCASPAAEFARRAADLGMITEIRRGAPLDHVIVRRPGPASHRLHVYLDGDGTPWLGGLPARDPTPRTPLALAFMARDPATSVYLGRPCYHGLAGTAGCTSQLWTSARYSETVVASMAAALRSLLRADGVDEIVWFGYSGGGSLAVLLAPRFAESRAVVTVAANLDIDAWADSHRNPRLSGSLNPARQPPLPDRIRQLHYAGGRDRVVPVEIVRPAVNGAARLIVLRDYDHVCCWERAWPEILAEVQRATSAAPLR
jgi:pimeloyl-ACP methyl ester carboxylesterase